MRRAPLAELHLHLYGCIRSERLLEMLARGQPAWSRYERNHERVFGRPSPARDLVERHRAGDPEARALFHELFVFGEEDAGSFARFQAKFDLITAASLVGVAYRSQEHHDAAVAEIRAVAEAVLEDQRREGIAHAEQRFFFGPEAPRALVERGLAELLAVYADAHGIEARLAPSLPRANPWSHWDVVQDLALGPHGNALTGVDFCFVEEGHPPKAQRALFEAVHAHNEKHPSRALAILYHVGESFEDKSLESAVRWVHEAAELGAHRLGHAIALGVDPEAYGPHVRRESVAERRDQVVYDLANEEALARFGVTVHRRALEQELAILEDRAGDEVLEVVYDHARLEEVRARQRFAMSRVRELGTVVEVCPTSNLRIGGLRDPRHHPVRRFLDEGLSVVIASDDPGIFDTHLQHEIDWVARHARLDESDVERLRATAWQSRSERLTGRIGD